MPAPLLQTIVLLTDFGLDDPYVGQMKGVLRSAAPGAAVIDLSHGVRPQDVAQAALFLAASWTWFPAGTVFVAVVDPGVGTGRRIVLLEREGRLFLAPDNGLLGLVLASGPARPQAYDLTPGPARDLELPSPSPTFHGRDVFAPLAGRLAAGVPPATLGPRIPLDSLVRPDWAEPCPSPYGRSVDAAVLHVDRFGNAVLNLSADPWLARLRAMAPLALSGLPGLPGRSVGPMPLALARTYADLPPGGLAVLASSQGYLELAVNLGSAAGTLGLSPGDTVRLASAGPAPGGPDGAGA